MNQPVFLETAKAFMAPTIKRVVFNLSDKFTSLKLTVDSYDFGLIILNESLLQDNAEIPNCYTSMTSKMVPNL